jgi:hypothetical protein
MRDCLEDWKRDGSDRAWPGRRANVLGIGRGPEEASRPGVRSSSAASLKSRLQIRQFLVIETASGASRAMPAWRHRLEQNIRIPVRAHLPEAHHV